MNYLQLINNPLINNETNKFRTIVKRPPYDTYGSETFYSKKISFDVPREYNNLCGIWIKVTATTAAETGQIQLYAGDFHFRSVSLRTKNGIVLATNTDRYYDIRSDELGKSPVVQSLENALMPYDATSNSTETKLTTTPRSFFVPFYSFFTENKEKMLPTKFMEPLEVVCLTNSSKETMGLDQELTSATYEINYVFYDDVTSPTSFNGVDIVSYDIYEEPVLNNTSASTTMTQLLTCPFPTFCTHFCARKQTLSTYTYITNIKFTVNGNTLTDIDDRIMFDLFCSYKSDPDTLPTNIESIEHYYHCSETGFQARHSAKDFVVFSGSMYPFNSILTLGNGNADDNLYTVHEYRYILRINKDGKVSKQNSDELIFNKSNYN